MVFLILLNNTNSCFSKLAKQIKFQFYFCRILHLRPFQLSIGSEYVSICLFLMGWSTNSIFLCSEERLITHRDKFATRWSQRGEFHISHDASRLISVFSPRWKERSRVSREIFNDLNFKMQLIQGKFQWALLIFGIWLIM